MNEHENENEIESELIGGKNPIVEALRSGRELNKIWVAEGLNMKSIGEILSLAKEAELLFRRFRNKNWMVCSM